MKLSEAFFIHVFYRLPNMPSPSRRFFARGHELAPETAHVVANMPAYLLDDIGVTVRMSREESDGLPSGAVTPFRHAT